MVCSRRVLLFLLIPVLAGGCSREDISREDVSGQCFVDISFSVPEFDTKSSIIYPESDVRTLSIGFYNEGHLEVSEKCFTPVTGIGIRLTIGRCYEVYTIANAEDFVMPEEENSLTDTEIHWDGAALTEKGIPMASHISFTPLREAALNIPLEKLVARCDIIIDPTPGRTFRVKDAGVRQSMAYISPFQEKTSCDSTATEPGCGHFDTDTSTLTFYMFENLRGTLLPENTDPWQKIPFNITDDAGLCTYIEITGDYSVTGGETSSVTYRFFPGEDATTNFDIRRNTLYTVRLRITGEGLGKDSWKISIND